MSDDRSRDLEELMTLIRSGVAEEEADAFLELVKAGRKIEGIKVLRQRIDSLREAKELYERIEAMLVDLRLVDGPQRSGCLGMIALVVMAWVAFRVLAG